jgi:PAS domain S-box-containing protein
VWQDRVKILIIDDDPTDRAIFKQYLQGSGQGSFAFQEEHSGAAGLRACDEFQPDCVLLDYSLPDIDGLTVLRQMGEGAAAMRFPVVMLTAIGSEQIAVEAMKLGLMDYLAKNPASMDHLPRTIENAIQRFQLERKIMLQRRELEERNRELEIAQSDLLQEKEKYRRLTEAIPQLVWSASPGRLIQYANRRLLVYSGQSANSSWPFISLVDRQDVGGIEEAWKTAAETGGVLETEVRLKRASDGTSRWHLVRAVPVYGINGRLSNWFGTCTDIDNQKQNEETIRQQQKLESIGLLAGGIAHDFNNLLVGIMGGASFALQSVDPNHPAYPMLNVVLRSSERAAHLTQQLLAYAGKGQMFVEAVNVSKLLEETCELVHVSISKSVELEMRIDHGIPMIEASPSQIQQLMMNLIINGSEAIGDRFGRITITTFVRDVNDVSAASKEVGYALSPGRFVGLEVTDTGCGMDEQTKARIFEPFFTTKFTGRGLGLAAAQGIVRSLRGWIEVRTAPGEGSTFRVMIPAKEQRRGRAGESASLTAEAGRARILLLDDEELVGRTAKVILEGAGYSVHVANESEEGLAMFRESRGSIDLILLDMNMPGKTSVEIVREIRTLDPQMPVAIVSGYSEEEVTRRFGPTVVSGFVQKPFTSSRLVSDIARILKSSSVAGST